MNPSIFFWSQEKFSLLSNFEAVELVIDGKEYSSVEHYYQSEKSTDSVEKEKIRLAKTAYKAKKLGRKVDSNLRADWEIYKLECMLIALRSKFNKEPFKSLLLSTNDSLLYEDSPYDIYWGTGVLGKVGSGANNLGKLLMQVRSEIK